MQDHAAVAPGRSDRQIQPARAVEVGQYQAPGRDVVARPLQNGQDRRILEVEAAAPAPVDRDRRVVEVRDDQVQVTVAVEIRDRAGPAQPGRDHHVGLGREAVRTSEVDEGAGIQVDGVLVAVDQDDVGPAVVVDIAGEGRGGPRAPQLRTPFSGEPVPPPVVEVAVHRHVGSPAGLVGEHHLRQRVVGETGRVHAPGAVRLQPHRFGETPAPAGVRGRVHRERLRRPLLADHQVAHAAAAQVGQRRVARPMGGHGQPSGLREAVGAAPVQPTALPAVLEVPAREGQVGPAVAVEVPGRHGQGVAAREPQRRAEATLRGDRHQELRRTSGDEHQRFGAEVDGDRQRRHGAHALRFGQLLGLGKVGRRPSAGCRHVRPALRVDAAVAAPVDARRPVGRGDDQLRVAVPVQVGGAELHALDRCVDVLLGLDAQIGLGEQPHPALGQECQVRAAVTVEVACGHRRAAVRRQHGLKALAQAGRRPEVDVGVQAAGVAALLVADDQVGVAVA